MKDIDDVKDFGEFGDPFFDTSMLQSEINDMMTPTNQGPQLTRNLNSILVDESLIFQNPVAKNLEKKTTANFMSPLDLSLSPLIKSRATTPRDSRPSIVTPRDSRPSMVTPREYQMVTPREYQMVTPIVNSRPSVVFRKASQSSHQESSSYHMSDMDKEEQYKRISIPDKLIKPDLEKFKMIFMMA